MVLNSQLGQRKLLSFLNCNLGNTGPSQRSRASMPANTLVGGLPAAQHGVTTWCRPSHVHGGDAVVQAGAAL